MGHIPFLEMETSLNLGELMEIEIGSNYTKKGEISDEEKNPWEDKDMYSMSCIVEYENIEDEYITGNKTEVKKMRSTWCKKKIKKNKLKIQLESFDFIESIRDTKENRNRAKCKTKSRFSYSMFKRLQDGTLRLGEQESSIGQRSAIFVEFWLHYALTYYHEATLHKKVFKILSSDCPKTSIYETQTFDARTKDKEGAKEVLFAGSYIEKKKENQCKIEEQTRKHRKFKDNDSKRREILKDIFLFIIIRLLKEVLEGNWITHIVLICTLFETTRAMYCPESMKTLSPVNACPLNKNDWLSASEKMKCESKNQSCCPQEDYKYHCLVNVFQNETFELCAPRIRLNYCLQYDDYGARVQINFHANCTKTSSDCGKFYDSNKAYEMPNCLKLKFEENDEETDEKTPEILKIPDKKVSRESNFTGIYVGIPTTITVTLILSLLWRKTVLRNMVCYLVNCNASGQNEENEETEDMI